MNNNNMMSANNYGRASAPPSNDNPPSYSESTIYPSTTNLNGNNSNNNNNNNIQNNSNMNYNQQHYPPSAINTNQIFQQIKHKYEINDEFGDKLQMLSGFKIVFVFDDSGSMNTVLLDSPLNQPNALKATRWDELKYFANISIEIASLFDPNGCDVYFLNKPPARGVRLENLSNFLHVFDSKPGGYTPLTEVVKQVLRDNENQVKTERKLLILIVTDGEPTDMRGNVDIKAFRDVLAYRSPIDRIFVTIVACTDDDSSIEYLNQWDRQIKHLDVVDDYRNEREEIRKVKGRSYHFSYGDFVVKSLVGSIDPTLDKMDEHPSGCCTLA